jgi:hypothetical protein
LRPLALGGFGIAISDGYDQLIVKVSVAVAKNNLPKLLRAAEDGESVTICRRVA